MPSAFASLTSVLTEGFRDPRSRSALQIRDIAPLHCSAFGELLLGPATLDSQRRHSFRQLPENRALRNSQLSIVWEFGVQFCTIRVIFTDRRRRMKRSAVLTSLLFIAAAAQCSAAEFAFSRGQRVYVVAVDGRSRDSSLTTADLREERRIREEFMKQKSFMIVRTLHEADFRLLRNDQ